MQQGLPHAVQMPAFNTLAYARVPFNGANVLAHFLRWLANKRLAIKAGNGLAISMQGYAYATFGLGRYIGPCLQNGRVNTALRHGRSSGWRSFGIGSFCLVYFCLHGVCPC